MNRLGFLVAFVTLLLVPVAANAATTTVTTDGDSFVESSTTNRGVNFGSSTNLRVRKSTSSNSVGEQQTYVKFPAPSVPAGSTGVSAVLRLYSKEAGDSKSVRVHTTSDFGESTLTWLNKPAISAPVRTQTVNRTLGYKSFPVPVNAQARNVYALTTTTTSNKNLAFDAKEGSLGDPQLVVTYTPPTVDTTPPNTTITASPPDGTSTSASFSFTSSESGSTFQCSLDGAAFASCTSPKTYSGLSVGAHAFSVKATDAAGNTDPTPATATWTISSPPVDTTPPNTTITDHPPTQTLSTDASFSFTSTEPGSTFECQLGGSGYSSCSSPKIYSGLRDGDQTFYVRATDAAGNTDQSPATFTWHVGPVPTQCDDGVDNDGDGQIDLADPGCSGPTDDDETDAPPPSGYPDASNTGVPAGTTLTAYTGPNTITTDNTVIDGKLINGGVEIIASNVTIRNSKIVNGYVSVGDKENYGNLPTHLTDMEIDCGGDGGSAVSEAWVTMLRVHIHGCENALDINQEIDMRDSFISSLLDSSNSNAHEDGVQFACGHWTGSNSNGCNGYAPGTKNTTLIHNTIYGMNADGGSGTSAIINNSEDDVNILVQNNLLAGGGYTVYCDPGQGDIRLLDNHFSTRFFPTIGFYGASTDCSDEVQSGNVIHETGQPITLQ